MWGRKNQRKVECFVIYLFFLSHFVVIKQFDCTDAGKVSDCECGIKAIHIGYNR